MKECKYCHKIFDDSVSVSVFANHCNWCTSNPNVERNNEIRRMASIEANNKKYGEIKNFEVTCLICKKNFTMGIREKLFDANKKYFCSKKCANTRIHTEETKDKIKTALIKYQNINNPGRIRIKEATVKYKEPKEKRPTRYCKNCGETVSNGYTVFCSNKCLEQFDRNRLYNDVESGSCNSFRRIKRYLILKNGNTCSICGFSGDWNGQPINMICDHINGRAADNRLENLRLVCPMCDTQLPTYKSKNKNSDRKNRKGESPSGVRVPHPPLILS